MTPSVSSRVGSSGFKACARNAMDDFGTAYSSLGYLHRLPIDELKLDRSFVQDLKDSETARTLTASVLRICESLRMKVVAQGRETEARCQFLVEHGCPVLQGYLFSRPLPAQALEDWLGTREVPLDYAPSLAHHPVRQYVCP
jgi:EAL domain-containing protein (putative c-di-GMP-specific phosphodiesterase class I)